MGWMSRGAALGWVWVGIALLLSGPAAGGERRPDCGGGGERPCRLWETLTACDAGLGKGDDGRCVAKLRPACGHQDQRPCASWEFLRACDAGLARDFTKDRCVPAGGSSCGRRNGPACEAWQRDQPCDPGLAQHFEEGICRALDDARCGREYQSPCAPLVRIPSCNPGLVEVFEQDTCLPPSCGGEWDRPCQAWEITDGVVEELPALRPGARIRLRTLDGAYLQTQPREGRTVIEALPGEPPVEAEFTVRAAGPGAIMLESHDGRLLARVARLPEHPIEVGERDDADAHFSYAIIDEARVALQASNGKYLIPVPRGLARALEAIGVGPSSASALWIEER